MPELAREPREHLVGHVAADADRQVRRAVYAAFTNALTSSSVIASSPATRAEGGVAVRRAREDGLLQAFLAELLFVVGAQVLRQRVELRVLDPLEVFLAQARVEQLRQHDVRRTAASCRGGRHVKVVISLSTCAPKPPAIG